MTSVLQKYQQRAEFDVGPGRSSFGFHEYLKTREKSSLGWGIKGSQRNIAWDLQCFHMVGAAECVPLSSGSMNVITGFLSLEPNCFLGWNRIPLLVYKIFPTMLQILILLYNNMITPQRLGTANLRICQIAPSNNYRKWLIDAHTIRLYHIVISSYSYSGYLLPFQINLQKNMQWTEYKIQTKPILTLTVR